MNRSDTQWKKSAFVNAAHVVSQQPSRRSTGKRLTDVIRSNNVKLNPQPVVVGTQAEKIKITPIMQNNQMKALHVSCSCGCESTFDIQYAAGGAQS